MSSFSARSCTRRRPSRSSDAPERARDFSPMEQQVIWFFRTNNTDSLDRPIPRNLWRRNGSLDGTGLTRFCEPGLTCQPFLA